MHPPSLIRVFAVRLKKVWSLSYPLSAQRRLWWDWADVQADLSLRWAHSWFCHVAAHFHFSHFHSHTQVQLLFDDVRVSQNTQNNAWSRDWMFLWMEFITRVYYGTNFFKWKITESFNNDVYFEYLSTLVIYFGRYNALDIESIINQILKEYVKRNKVLIWRQGE